MTTEPGGQVTDDDAIVGRVFYWSLAGFAVAGLLTASVLWWAGREAAPESLTEVTVPDASVPPMLAPPEFRFADITRNAGIDFVHENGAGGEKLLPETMGGGVVFFDYDNDGDPDLLFVNGAPWPWNAAGQGGPPGLVLYANDGTGGFTDVTVAAQLDAPLYGMGAAAADVDGDGWRDLFVTTVGENRLLMNRQGRFVEATASAGVGGGADTWSSGAVFLDYDRDGDLDLFVVNYIQWSRDTDLAVDFRLAGVGRAYGPPTSFVGTQPWLYRNRGDGTFDEVSQQAGLTVHDSATGTEVAKSLAIGVLDIDDDGWLDLFVANDTTRNFLYRNLGDGRFAEEGMERGVAFDRNGAATGAMGVDITSSPDSGVRIAVGNFANEMSSLYATQTPGQLADEAIINGIGAASRSALTFGVLFADLDLDGYDEYLQANGHIENDINRVQPSQQYAQPTQLFWGCGQRCGHGFLPVGQEELGDLAKPLVGRGLAAADIDADGDIDLVISQVGGPPRLLRNDTNTENWLRVALRGPHGNTDGIGALVTAHIGDETRGRRMMPIRGYLSQSEAVLTFGIGEQQQVERLVVTWPDGVQQELGPLAADQVVIVTYPQ